MEGVLTLVNTLYKFLLLVLLIAISYKSYKKLTTLKIHSLSRPNYNLTRLLDEEIDSASFASFGSWFQSIAPLNLKLLFRNFLFGLASVRSVAVLRTVDGNYFERHSLSQNSSLGRRRCDHLIFYTLKLTLHNAVDHQVFAKKESQLSLTAERIS